MLVNIIDKREESAHWQRVSAAVEPASADDRAVYEQADAAIFFTPQQRTLSVAAAVQWATRLPYGVDLYLFDAPAD